MEKRAREEADKRANEEIKRLAAEKEKKAQLAAAATKVEKPLPSMGGLDDMVAVAEADLFRSQGKNEEAAKIYRDILKAHPENQSVQKKLEALEELLNPKSSAMPAVKTPPVLKIVEKPAPAPLAPPENDSNIKKKSNKIGYV